MKFKVGDRVRYYYKDSEHNGRIGTVTDVVYDCPRWPYCITLDAISGFSKDSSWVNEDDLEPYYETFRDRLEHEHPEEVGEQYGGGCHGCPGDYDYEPIRIYCDAINETSCRKCWDRQIPTNASKLTNITTYKRGTCECGSAVSSDYAFCPHCGVKLEWNAV